MTAESCERCPYLGWMNTRGGKRDCCKWFKEPQLLEDVECVHERYLGFSVVLPRIFGKNFDPNL